MMNEMEQKFVEKVDTYYDDMVETACCFPRVVI